MIYNQVSVFSTEVSGAVVAAHSAIGSSTGWTGSRADLTGSEITSTDSFATSTGSGAASTDSGVVLMTSGAGLIGSEEASTDSGEASTDSEIASTFSGAGSTVTGAGSADSVATSTDSGAASVGSVVVSGGSAVSSTTATAGFSGVSSFSGSDADSAAGSGVGSGVGSLIDGGLSFTAAGSAAFFSDVGSTEERPLACEVILRGLDTLVFGGVFGSTFSCVLFAELAVGRIILARKPSSGDRALALTRELGLSCALLLWGERETREGCLRTVVVREVVAPVGLLGFKLDGLRFNVVVAVPARLDAREVGPPVPRRAADEAVCAVIEGGRLTGRVGDLVRVLVLVVVLVVCFWAASLPGSDD